MLAALLSWVRQRWGTTRTPVWQIALENGLRKAWDSGKAVSKIIVSRDMANAGLGDYFFTVLANPDTGLVSPMLYLPEWAKPIIVEANPDVKRNEIILLSEEGKETDAKEDGSCPES